ncbi:MAG: hypothetical protein ABFS28_14040 [Bacteroidota bacterium]
MGRLFALLMGLSLSCMPAMTQTSYLSRPDLLEQVEAGLDHTYGFSFQEARIVQGKLAGLTPEHPAPVFLEALIIYWENFPLTPDDQESDLFIALMDRVVEMAEGYAEDERTHLEGIFFDLFGRALQAMFWADNGKPARLVPDLGAMYRHTKEGFDLKEDFVEFYFSTGLYNYYIEAYPEARPVYKPLVSFMESGNKELGLKQLEHAINNTVYLKVESLLFMSLIQLNYEDDLSSALYYMSILHGKYPKNIYYQGLLATILLHLHKYEDVSRLTEAMSSQKDAYSEMIRTMTEAYMAEHLALKTEKAKTGYLKTVALADSFGPMADIFKAIGYMGLSRIYEKKGLESDSKRYARRASNHTVYSFILDP